MSDSTPGSIEDVAIWGGRSDMPTFGAHGVGVTPGTSWGAWEREIGNEHETAIDSTRGSANPQPQRDAVAHDQSAQGTRGRNARRWFS